ncbi:ATP-binding protein [Streptomyces sp. SGAir0957]
MPEDFEPDSSPDGGPRLFEISVDLDGDAGCIARARASAAGFLRRAREQYRLPVADRIVENVQLVVSELVTNAIKYAPGPARLQMRIQDATVWIEVWDSAPHRLAVHDTNPQRIGQHGLEIVTLLTRTLTVYPDSVGKRVTASLDLHPPHGLTA